MNRSFWGGKRVFLTGHTGFKGGWLALWLTDMGADVHGYSLDPPTNPSFADTCGLSSRIKSHVVADIRNADALSLAIRNAQPQIVLHLAAQSLVRASYANPVETFSVNVMGTVNLLEAVRHTPGVVAVVNVTTDKCYENREWVWAYRENEAMGGYDPYSSSKGCSELITSSYRRSFLTSAGTHLASARAGNVIGGGDWADDRLIPDFLRALDAGKTLTIRSPNATRPWQHVLEPLSGYLTLAEKLYGEGDAFAEAWNFGSNDEDAKPVGWIVEYLCAGISGSSWKCDDSPQPHEANHLKLDSAKAKSRLAWLPRWKLETALSHTLSWHRAWRSGKNMAEFTIAQIHEYESANVS